MGKLPLLIFILLLQVNSRAQNLIAHYPLDNGAALDISGNANNGIIIGGVQSDTDRFGNPCGALLFNGFDGYIEVNNSPSLKSPVNAFSATCWFKMKSLSSAGNKWLTLICKGTNLKETLDNPQYRVQVFQSSTQSTVSINTDFTEYDYVFDSHFFPENEWNFYALVYNGEYVKTYLNGSELWSFPYKKPLVQNNGPLHIAKDIPGATEFFSGSYDDIRIFNTGLSEIQINRIYKDNSYSVFDFDFNLICPGNIDVNTDKNRCFATVIYAKPLLDIPCGTAVVKQISGPLSGSGFPIGSSTLVFEAESIHGIKKSCYSKVIVKDIEPPVFNLINDTTLFIEDGNTNGKIFNYALPLATDNCSVTIKLKSGLPDGSLFPVGKNLLKFIATDNSGSQTELFYTVHVLKKNNSISVNCPEDIIKANDYHKCGAIVHFNIPDSINRKALKLEEGRSSGSFYKVGDTKNRYKNSPGNECLFMVKVFDDEKPEIRCQNDTIIYAKKNQNGATYFYSQPKALDNCKIDMIGQVKGIKSGSIFPVGKTQNMFIARDIYGNSAECSFTVTVLDTSNLKVKPNVPDVVGNIKDSIKYYRQGLEFKKCTLTLAMYDDSKQDGDTISLYFNGIEIVSKELITIKKNGTINRVLNLEPNKDNYFIFKAWNEGSISPNTLRIEIYEGDFLDKMNKLKRKRPAKTFVMHAKVGVASAISFRCKK